MTWFKVDDGFSDHPKVRSIPRASRAAAIGLWALAGSWSAKNLTDGHVPEYMLAELGCTKGQAAALVQAGLWLRAGDGYDFHEWDGHQPSREQVEERRTKTAERVARWRASKASSSQHHEPVRNAVTDGVANGVSNAAPVPDPTRPVPSTSTSAPTERVAPEARPPIVPAPAAEVNAGHVVAAWTEACQANGVTPSTAQRSQVGKQARELLVNNDAAKVMEAAVAAGGKGYASVDRELTALNGRSQSSRKVSPIRDQGFLTDPDVKFGMPGATEFTAKRGA